MHIRSDRRKHMPYGLAGGQDGTPSWNILNPGRSDEEILPIHVTREVRSGDVLRHITGGSYGAPGERARDVIRREVLEGKFSADYVRLHYGVTLAAAEGRPCSKAAR